VPKLKASARQPWLLCLCLHRAEALSDAFVWRLVWRLSVANIEPKSRTERTRNTKIGTEVAHVTHDLDTTFKVKRSTCCWCLNSQHAGTGATWRVNTKILSTCRPGRRHIVSPRAPLVSVGSETDSVSMHDLLAQLHRGCWALSLSLRETWSPPRQAVLYASI